VSDKLMIEQILALLHKAPLSTNALCAALKVLPRQLKPTLAQMLEAEQIIQATDGRYKFKPLVKYKLGKTFERPTLPRSEQAGIPIKQAAESLGIKSEALRRRLIANDLLSQCTLDGTWYVPNDILKLVSGPKLIGYTTLKLAARARGVEPSALIDTLKDRGLKGFKTIDEQIYIDNLCLLASDREEKHSQTLPPDERKKRDNFRREKLATTSFMGSEL